MSKETFGVEMTDEERVIAETIVAARQVQEFLWGESNGNWGIEEWLRTFRKRVAKLDVVDLEAPYASVEMRKRLLQTAALSVALIKIIDKIGIPQVIGNPPSNLPEFAREENC